MGASAGRVLLIPKGDWNASTTYTGLDWVRHNGAAWVCKNTCTGIEPTEANADNWQMMARDGQNGSVINADAAMSDTSVNPVQNKVIKSYVDTRTTFDSSMSSTSTNAVQNKVVKSYVDNSIAGISDMTGATATQNGAHGLVPAPQIGDEKKVLLGDGTWGAIDDKFTFADHDTNKSGTSFTDAEDGNMIVTDWTKNLLNPTLETTKENGVTCTNNGDGTYTLNGKVIDRRFIIFNIGTYTLEKNKTYKFIGMPDLGLGFKCYVDARRDNNTQLQDTGSGDIDTSKNGQTGNPMRIVIDGEDYSDIVLNNVLIKPMITTDLSATYDDFVPYGGYEIQSCGKNLVESYYVTKTELQYEAVLFIKADLQPDTDYVISLVGANGNNCYLNEYLFEQNDIAFDGTRQYVIAHTKAVFKSDQYIDGYGWIIFKNSTGNTVVPNFQDIQLEKASEPTPFEPYTGETITVTNDTESPTFGLKSHKGITNIISPGNVKCVYPMNESGKGVLDAMYNNSQLSNELSKLKNAIIAMGGTV